MNFEQARFNMIEQQIRPWEVLDPEVLELLSVIRREDFVPAAHRALAFADLELPIGGSANPSQTMLAPKTEARLLQEVDVRSTDRVLEIGTGTGYMAALLAAKAEYVYTVEIDPALAETARANLQRAGAANVAVEVGDGSHGWAAHAPYDVIVVSASMPVLPDEFLSQLKVGGRLVAIVGEDPVMEAQLVTRTGENAYSTINLFETVVAPLVNAVQREAFVF
ncbi:MAG: protein-L-isoaspartate O-methyltransferase [Candidatus Accumulibacter sp.]|nr:protein-L-isoaspartate O-methyltransferase [Accumulibacter sp.]